VGTEIRSGGGVIRIRVDRWTVATAVLVVIAVAMRVQNSIAYPVPRGYDSFGHVMYIWYLLKTGRVPLANEGWSLFHPPLYFACAAAIWRVLERVDPIRVMHVISLGFAVLGVIPAWVSFAIVRRYFGSRPVLLLLAPAFVLFLPVGIYTAPMIGNEGLHAVLCAIIIYCLLRTVTDFRRAWAVGLGVSLGLALLTKFTASGMLLASTIAVALVGWHRGAVFAAIKLLAVALSIAFVISGWFYIRNFVEFGNPFQMSRDFFFVQRIENYQAPVDRTLSDYVSVDVSIFRMPSMFRPGAAPVRSVWTGVFANTWFDAFGGWFLPGANSDPRVRDCGRVILLLALVPTALVLLGLVSALWRLQRHGWDDTLVTLLVVFGVIVAMYVQYTRSVPLYSTLKASYLLPVTVVFSFWLVLGFAALSRWPRWQTAVAADMGILAALIVPVFSYGLLFQIAPGPQDQNARGVVCYLAGFRDRAASLFASAAQDGLYVGHENMATIALENGDPYYALAEIARAEALMPLQVIGNRADRAVHIRAMRAEYQNTRASIYDQLGWRDLALKAARDAADLDSTLPEAYYNQAVLLLKAGLDEQAAEVLPRAVELDPNFVEAWVLAGSLDAAHLDCTAAVPALEADRNHVRLRRRFPVETGWGDVTDAGIARRKLIPRSGGGGEPQRDALALCRESPGDHRRSAPVAPASTDLLSAQALKADDEASIPDPPGDSQ
jgi:tetratricopeptide (TPR) repeat protein